MSQPELFHDATQIQGLLADLSLAVRYDGLRPRCDVLPAPVRLIWGDVDRTLTDAELVYRDDTLVLKVYAPPSHDLGLRDLFNESVSLVLEDDSNVKAEHVMRLRVGSQTRSDGNETNGISLDLEVWEWTPASEQPYVLVGQLPHVGRIYGDNLSLHTASGKRVASSRCHFRGEGNLTWHILDTNEGHAALAEPGPGPIAEAIRKDLLALQFVFGTRLPIGALWLVRADGTVIGGRSTGFDLASSPRKRCPTPNEVLAEICWSAPLFKLLATGLKERARPLSIALAGYLDPLAVHVHGGYLLAQVALEAFCSQCLPKPQQSTLVESNEKWNAWVDSQKTSVSELATDAESASIILNRIRHNVTQEPSGKTVKKAFSHWGIELPKEVLAEIAKRNTAAHDYVMFDEESGDVDVNAIVSRINMIQALLAVAIAKHIGYSGALVGWERDGRGNLKPIPFWSATASPDAKQQYVCKR